MIRKRSARIPELFRNPSVRIISLCLLVYFNANFCDFVFDDVSAIKDNKDIRPSSSLLGLFRHDFWGTPMSKEHSHKSYRPICVLTFRLNYLLHELNPVGYHLANILLHCAVCLLYHKWLASICDSPSVNLTSTLLFVVHPIHTEAVTGVVGRAELLSSIFFLLGLMIFQKGTVVNNLQQRALYYASFFLAVSLAMLSKEQGVTVLGLCFVYELFFVQKIHIGIQNKIWGDSTNNNKLSQTNFINLGPLIERTSVLFLVGLALILVRLKIVMGSTLPVFTSFDNPAAHEPAPIKQLTWAYLLAKNFWLLLSPSDLCCDWTMGSIPLITSLADPRNLGTIIFIAGFLHVCVVAVFCRRSEVVIFAMALITLPFLPASNLFFPVGFVIAERILYIPSMGYCLLVSYGLSRLTKKFPSHRKMIKMCLLSVIVIHSVKTVARNLDWKNESAIFLSGLRVNSNNAKLWNNVGHALEGQGHFEDALKYFSVAAKVQPDDVGAHINVGRTLNSLGQFEKAEQVYQIAKAQLPQPKKGQRYTTRIAPQHLSVFLNLANLIAKNPERLEEADVLYRQAISMRSDYVQAYINRGDVLIKMGRLEEAKEVYESALTHDANNADLYYNIGVVDIELGLTDEAQDDFSKALKIDPDHVQSLMNSAILMQSTGRPELRPLAYERLFRVLDLSPNHHTDRVYFNLGMLGMDDRDSDNAEQWFKKAVEIKPNFRSALFNLALLLNEQKRPLEALPYLTSLHNFYPDHIKGLILMGDIYTNHVKDLRAAEKCYRQILEVDPKHIQGHHNLCVVLVEQGHLLKARECLLQVQEMAPNEDYVRRHLQIVENRIKSQTSTDNGGKL